MGKPSGSYRAPIHRRGPTLLSSAKASYPQRRHPQIPSHWGVGQQQMDLGGHTSDPSSFCLKFSGRLPPSTFRLLRAPWNHLLPLQGTALQVPQVRPCPFLEASSLFPGHRGAVLGGGPALQ